MSTTSVEQDGIHGGDGGGHKVDPTFCLESTNAKGTGSIGREGELCSMGWNGSRCNPLWAGSSKCKTIALDDPVNGWRAKKAEPKFYRCVLLDHTGTYVAILKLK